MQFGLDAVIEVICAFSDLSVGLAEVSSRRNSWRLLGGRVKRRGRDMFANIVVVVAAVFIVVNLFIILVLVLLLLVVYKSFCLSGSRCFVGDAADKEGILRFWNEQVEDWA